MLLRCCILTRCCSAVMLRVMQRVSVTLTEDAYDLLRLEAAAKRLSMSGYAGVLLERALDGGEPSGGNRSGDGASSAPTVSAVEAPRVASSPPSSAALTPDVLAGAGGGTRDVASASPAAGSFKPDPKPGSKS